MKFENAVDSLAAQGPEAKYHMKWYKFLIWFALFAGAIANVGQGINYITGDIHELQSMGTVSAEQVYAVFGKLKTIDIIYGIVLLALAALGVVTWLVLKKRKRSGPVLLLCLYGVTIGLAPYMYRMACLDITGAISPMFLVELVAAGVMVALNHVYFSKRSELFKN